MATTRGQSNSSVRALVAPLWAYFAFTIRKTEMDTRESRAPVESSRRFLVL